MVFENIKKKKIESLPNPECIIVGDWNLILLLDPCLDCLHFKHVNDPRARRQVLSLKSDTDSNLVENNFEAKTTILV